MDLLREGPLTTGAVADAFGDELSRFAVMQHLKVLEDAELVVPRRKGRRRFNHLNVVPLRRIQRRWVDRYTGAWADALTTLKEEMEKDSSPHPDASGSVA